MDSFQQLTKSDQYWHDLIQQCRTSGMSDHQWLELNNIKSGTFYYHVKQLRKKACKIPENYWIGRGKRSVQEVVPVVFEDAMSLTSSVQETATMPVPAPQTSLTDNTVAVRLNIQGISVEIANHATQEIIKNILSALQSVC